MFDFEIFLGYKTYFIENIPLLCIDIKIKYKFS